jgi:hypothetical protein
MKMMKLQVHTEEKELIRSMNRMQQAQGLQGAVGIGIEDGMGMVPPAMQHMQHMLSVARSSSTECCDVKISLSTIGDDYDYWGSNLLLA